MEKLKLFFSNLENINVVTKKSMNAALYRT